MSSSIRFSSAAVAVSVERSTPERRLKSHEAAVPTFA
jgi:hypothetical protein